MVNWNSETASHHVCSARTIVFNILISHPPGAGTLLALGSTPPPRPPPRTKHATSKIPTKLGRTAEEAAPERPVEEAARVDLEEASNMGMGAEEVKKAPAPVFEKVS